MSKEKKDSSSDVKNNEDPQQCYIPNDNDDYSTSKVSVGEVCTIQNAKAYGIFGKYKYFNDAITKDEQTNINVYNNETDDKNYKLCVVDDENKNAYTNCALSTQNPWKTLSEKFEYCMLPLDITLPTYLSYSSNSESVIEKPKDIIYITQKNKLCNETWYDWFTIPDYHIGNKIIGNDTQDKCYAACDIGTIPWKLSNTEGDYDQCINRDKYKYGLYKNEFYYTPHALIMLLGSSKKYLIQQHIKEMKKRRDNMKDLVFDYDIYNDIISNDKTQENIFQNIRTDIGKQINSLLSIPFDHTNIIVPSKTIQNESNKIFTKDNVMAAYEIASAYHYFVTNNNDQNVQNSFTNWKKDLSLVSGLNTTDQKFYKQLLILKKACNIMFDNKSEYSKNIFYNFLNTKLEGDEKIKQPIEFKITEDDILLSISKNHSEKTNEDNKYSTSQNIERKKEIEKQEIAKVEEKKKNGDIELGNSRRLGTYGKAKFAQSMTENTSNKDDQSNDNKSDINFLKYVKMLVFLLVYGFLFIVFGIFIWMIVYVLWPYIAGFTNKTILASASMVYYVQDLLRGRYTASSRNINMLEMQKRFLNKILITELKYQK